MSGRKKEVALIRGANKAAAVGCLMLGDLSDWTDYISVGEEDLGSLPRRQLKSRKIDVGNGIRSEIDKFCSQNFVRCDDRVLERLYDAVLDTRGLEMPLLEFQDNFAKLRPQVLRGNPLHATVCISLWGLQFKFPEDFLRKDVVEALQMISECEQVLEKYRKADHIYAVRNRDELRPIIRKKEFAARMGILTCFNLLEAFLNGMAWWFEHEDERYQELSNKKKKLVQDGSFRDKLLHYPEIFTGTKLWSEDDGLVRGYLERVKPFRDALVHASPFSQPDRFGGLDKLQHVYLIDSKKAREAAKLTIEIIGTIWMHVHGDNSQKPIWLQELETSALQNGV